MLARDYLEEVVWSFRKQRLRTALTATGIAIGAFAIAIMVGLGEGVQSYIEEQIRSFGSDRVLMVYPERAKFADRIFDQLARIGKPAQRLSREQQDERKLMRGGIWITPEQVERVRALPDVVRVSPMTWLELDGVALVPEGANGEWVPEEWFETDFGALATHPLVGHPLTGRLPHDDAPDEVVLSPQYAQSWGLAPERLVGREVALRVPNVANIPQRFMFRDPTQYKEQHRVFRARVVGLAERSPASRSVFASLGLGREMTRYQSSKEDLLSDEKIGFNAYVRVREGASLREVKKQIQEVGLRAKSMDDQLAEVTRSFLVVKLALSLFGLIAVLVATLGIANTLLMAISERTREIGVMKALGATEATIRRMFAVEAAAIGFVGGIIGSLAAIALGSLLNLVARKYFDAEAFGTLSAFSFPWWLILGSVAFSTAVGAVAGLYPANRAARLDPIDALRYE
jgi:putative ABC transport system permease protein